MSIYKACDIRGVYGEDFSEQDAYNIGRAVARVLDGRDIVVGGDFRTHTPPLKRRFIEGLTTGGAQVIDIGQLSTPQMYFSKRFLGAYASAQITASHNPAKYNGLKLMLGALPVLPEDIEALHDIVANGDYRDLSGGSVCTRDTTQAYADMLQESFHGGARRGRIVIDAGNGAMGVLAPAVMRRLGFTVDELFCNIDGTFPGRNPNPALLSSLTALCERVRTTHADFGAAFDGDGDRVIFVDAQGTPLSAEEAMVIFSDALLTAGNSVVYDIKCSSILKDAVQQKGCEAIMERSGHAFIRRTFMQRGSRLAGEVSGHYFFSELEGDDGLFALVKLGEIFSRTTQPLRTLLSHVRYPAITPDIRIKATEKEVNCVFRRMEDWAKASPEATVSRLDGIRMAFPDGEWVLLRRSVTEPLFTLRMEAKDAAALERLRARVREALQLKQL